MERIRALRQLAEYVSDELVVTNLGTTASEWWSLRPSEANLYTMGMGLVTPVGLGLALGLPRQKVIVLDGDGSMLFNLGILATVANTAPANLTILVFDNEAYASTGLHSTATAGRTDLAAIARAAGIEAVSTVNDEAGFVAVVRDTKQNGGPAVVVVKVGVSPTRSARNQMNGEENKYRFVRHIETITGQDILRPLGGTSKVAPGPDGDREPVAGASSLAKAVLSGFRAAGIDFAAMLPASQLSDVQVACRRAEGIDSVMVTNEGEGAAICAGAWMAGKRPVLIAETSGAVAAAYALTRCHKTFGVPGLLLLTHRGQIGERRWFAVKTGAVLEPLLAALGIPQIVVTDVEKVSEAIQGAQQLMDASLNPAAVLLAAGLTAPRDRH